MSILSEYQIRQRATSRSFERGEHYYAAGAVGVPILRADKLEAYVEGTQSSPYHVVVTLGDGNVTSASCTCPYDGKGDCKHIVAVMLIYIRQNTVPLPSVDDLLTQMSASQLRELIRTLRSHKPELEDWFRVMLPSMTSTPTNDSALSKPPPKVDTRAFRRQVQQAVDRLDYRNHWESIWDMVRGLDEAQVQASTFLAQGDFDGALALMRIVGEEVAPHYGDLEEESQLAMFLEGWSEELTEAILGADLSPAERQTLSDQLDEWMVELSDYGLDDTLDAPITACVQGWESAPSEYAVDLTEAKLNVIAHQGDTDRYLTWCLEQNAYYRYALRLAEMGRIDEAVAHVREHPLRVQQYEDEYHDLARFLHEQGHIEAAFQVGMLGLENGNPPRAALAQWVAEIAETTGRTEAAAQAWQTAFESRPSLAAYRAIKRLTSDKSWESLRPQLIEQVAASSTKDVLIEIYIEEQHIDRAIETWEKVDYGGYVLREKVVDAAAATHPDWAVEQALIEARHLIVKGSKYYPKAVNWLGKVKQIYLQHDREADWQRRVAQIRDEHGRKYALMDQLDKLVKS